MTSPSESTEKSQEYYIGLSYPIEIQKAEEGGFVVSIPTLPGCITQVEKWEEAQNEIERVRKEWIRAALEDGIEIPLPKTERGYSGKFVLRIPKSMHRKLDERAADEVVSLNTLLVSMISQCLGSPKAERVIASSDSRQEEFDPDQWEKLMSGPPSKFEKIELRGRSYWDNKILR